MSQHARQIVAIMFTDVVGYSAWVQRNEALALDMLKLHWALLRPVFARFDGREIKTIGDAFLIEFPSALQAVRAGIEMQAILEKHNRDADPDRHIRIRIGIHTGDVERMGEDLFGDGVNIASRIEPLAPPGGICISESVYTAVQNKVYAPFYSLGTQRLKNISQTVVVYCDQPVGRKGLSRRAVLAGVGIAVSLLVVALAVWKFGAIRETVSDTAAAGSAPATLATVDHPRLAVLPLANFSPDPDNAFFTDGLHDDILTALSRLKGVDVISRTTMQTFRDSRNTLSEIAAKLGATHVLEGSVRRDELRVRLTVQLIDARTDDHLWAETYDRPLTDALALQSAVATEVASALKVAIGAGAITEAPTTVPAAYDLYLKARVTTDSDDQLKLLDSALLLDPAFTLARAARAATATEVLWAKGWRLVELGRQVRADIDQARHEQPGLIEVDVAEGYYAYRVQRDYRAALEIVDRVLAAGANTVEGLSLRAFLLRRIGRRDEALASIRQALEFEPGNARIVGYCAEMLMYYGRFRDAIRVLDQAQANSPNLAEDLFPHRLNAEFYLTGDIEPVNTWAESVRDDENYKSAYYEWQGPSPERLEFFMSEREDWLQAGGNASLVPRALVIAVDADLLGRQSIAQQALAEAELLYQTIAPELMALPENQALHALVPALRGDSAAAIAEVERAIAGASPSRDLPAANNTRYYAIVSLARAGARDRAIEVLRSLVEGDVIDGVALQDDGAFTYHDKVLRALLGEDPRYQALMRKIADQFEPL